MPADIGQQINVTAKYNHLSTFQWYNTFVKILSCLYKKRRQSDPPLAFAPNSNWRGFSSAQKPPRYIDFWNEMAFSMQGIVSLTQSINYFFGQM